MNKNVKNENSKVNVDPIAFRFTIFLDELFDHPAYQRDVLSILNDATENDQIEILVNSDGGSISASLPIIIAMRQTGAIVTTKLLCEAHSAASMILLSGDNILISPYSSMLIHSASFGSWGKAVDVKSHVDHTVKRCEEIFKDVYYGFLSENEIEEVLNGKELYLDYDQILEKLKSRQDIFQKEQEDIMAEMQPPSRQELEKMTKKQIIDELLGEED